MKRNLLFILVVSLFQIGTQIAVNAQDLSVSDIQDSGCQRGTRSRANENETKRTIVLTKEGTILTVQILGFVSNCATMGFDITPNMSGGSDGEPVSVSLGVEPIEPDVASICICPFNVSFTLHGLETNSFYFTCWWYEGQVSLTEGEPLTLESITEPVHVGEWYYTIDKVNHTAIVRGVDGETDDLTIPWFTYYEGEDYFVTGIDEAAFLNDKTLSSVNIPTNLTHIGYYAFAYCSNLKDVYCFADQVPTTGSDVFQGTPIASATLHVPAGLIDKYKATAPWNEFGNIVAIEEPHQPLPFLEGNPIWEYKYEHIPTPRSDDWMKYWLDTGDRIFTYYFLGGQKEIDGKVYTMMGEITSRGEENSITFNRWYPIREENGIVYTITDSLPGVIWHEYNDDYKIPYLQQGNECIIYNFCTEIGKPLYPQDEYSTVESFDTYQLMDGTICRVLKTTWDYLDLYEKLGLVNFDNEYGIIDPYCGIIISTNGHVYVKRLNAYFEDNVMLYKAPDAQEDLCVNDTCWTREDAEAYAPSYKADPRQEEVFSYIRQLQMATQVTYTKGQMATIILPTAPDAGKGKYYRLDKCEDGKIIFEQEKQPQAHIPYIIVPSEDFSIDTSTLDLAGLSPDTVSIAGISFIGSYSREKLNEQEGWYIDIIDTTPDCQAEEGKAFTIGALRAYLTVNWDDPINHGGSKGPGDKLEIVLKDNPNSLTPTLSKGEGDEIVNGKWSNGKWFDLQGRKLSGKPAKGVYINDGKKFIAQ